MQMCVYSGKVWTNIGSEMQICEGYKIMRICMYMEVYIYIATSTACFNL